MIFTLEALEAKHGDALVLYGGGDGDTSLVVIDGGPHRVYRGSLRKRLESLRRGGEDLHIPLVMVSHLDEDHIQGLVDLTNELVEMADNPENLPEDLLSASAPLPYRIDALWYNGFDKILDNREEELESLAASAVIQPDPPEGDVRPLSETLPASVKQGLQLRANVDHLSISVNDDSQLILAPAEGRRAYAFHPADKYFYELGPDEEQEDGALKLTVLGPTRDQLLRLHKQWDIDLKTIIKKEEEKKADAEGAGFKDDKIFNLSSVVVLAEADGKSMLLTGDARGDHIMEAAGRAGLLEDGVLRVDLLKLPHHGSDRNVDTSFFRMFPADHYVVSADGRFDNPSLKTFDYLFEARANDDRPFTIYLTNETGSPGKNQAHMDAVVAELSRRAEEDSRVTVVYRRTDEPSVVIDLADRVDLPGVV